MKRSCPVYFDPWKSTLSAGAPATVVRVSAPRVPGTVTRPLRRTGSQPASIVDSGTDWPRSATMKSGAMPLVVSSLASASTGFAIVTGAALRSAQPLGTLTEMAPSDELTGPRPPVTSKPGTNNPTTAMRARVPPPIRSQIGQLMPDELDRAGAGKGAPAVGWTRAGGGVGVVGLGVAITVAAASAAETDPLLSAPTRRVWHLGQTDSPFAYHVQQVRQTARLIRDPDMSNATDLPIPSFRTSSGTKQPARTLAGWK